VTQAKSGHQPDKKVLVALGSNATSQHGTPRQTVSKALRELDNGPSSRLVAKSRLYLTPFVPAGQGADVVNAVALVETNLEPRAFLARLHAIEKVFDRDRNARWADRTLDLDIVAFGDLVLPDAATLQFWIELDPARQKEQAPETLVLPHPRLQDRAFVLVPAAEILPDWRHPLTGLTIGDMRDALPDDEVDAVTVLDE
jgi:2-amino-4-hydroxy-6-hydroxymethyldihydropteridine diphosphokinase